MGWLVNQNEIRKRLLSLHPAIFAVVIREYPQRVFDIVHGMSRWKKTILKLFRVPETVIVDNQIAQITIFVFGFDFDTITEKIKSQEEFLKGTGFVFNFDIYQLDQDDFRSSKQAQ